jgi:hypothetical protein
VARGLPGKTEIDFFFEKKKTKAKPMIDLVEKKIPLL